jgi:hypothetical protein
MRVNLIKLEKTGEISEVKILNSTDVIKRYPPLTKDAIHQIDDVSRLPGTEEDSYIFIYKDVLLKFAMAPEDDIESFYRQIIIGLELNKLDNSGFVRTIGYYNDDLCKIPVVSDFVKKPCIYLYLERVNGPTMKKFIKSASLLQFRIVISKLARNYKVALDKYGFTHYDLHLSNLIISAVGEELMPVLIDFEAAHISLEDGDLGENFTDVGRYPGESNWIYDFFKLLGFCWLETNEEYMIRRARENHKETIMHWMEYISEVYRIPFQQVFDEDVDDYVPIEETLFEYLDRAAEKEGKRDIAARDQILAMKDKINEAEANIQTTKDLFQANRVNMQGINDHCIRLLTYFHADVSDEWLTRYHKRFDRHFSSWRTEEGKASNFDEFISFCDSFIGF